MENSSPPTRKAWPPPLTRASFRGHHAKHLVADIVAVGIIEVLEVIDVHDGEGVALGQREQRVIEGAARRECGEFVVIGEEVRVLDDGAGQDESGNGEVSAGDFSAAARLHSQKSRGQSPEKTALDRSAIRKEAEQRDCGNGGEGQPGKLREGRPGKEGIREKRSVEKRWRRDLSGTAEHGDKNRLQKKRAEEGSDGGKSEASLTEE